MNIQEAYNKGLTDAENNIILGLKSILKGESYTFQNPTLQEIMELVKSRSDYHHDMAARNNNVGKGFKKKIKEDNEAIDKIG